MDRILVIDDSAVQIEFLNSILKNDYEITMCQTAADGLRAAKEGGYSLILLDVVMPDMDGFTLIRELKATDLTRHVPVIMITGLADIQYEERGLLLGAVDYIAKPFRARELVSRIRGALRRKNPTENVLAAGDVRLDVASAAVTKDGREVFLSALEYRLLLYFLQHKGRLVTRENLRDAIWDSAGEYVSDNALNVYVKRLREKVETDPSDPQLIVTVRGLGYKVGK